jgi:Polysaccharide lyase
MATVSVWLSTFKKAFGFVPKSRVEALQKALGIRMLRKSCYLIAAVLAVLPVGAEAGTYYSITAEPENGASIENRGLCSSTMGSGGNLMELGQTYFGKCEGGGIEPEIVGTQTYLKHLWFRNDPKCDRNSKKCDKDSKTRTELAVTQQYFPFDEQVYLGFRMMIPRGTDITVDSSFYLLQLWQCGEAPPIGGINLTGETSHRVKFMTRGDFRHGSFVSLDMLPGVWHRFIVSIIARPRNGGELKVWIDQNPNPFTSTHSFGFFNVGKCDPGLRPPQHFRVKFGIYKDTEPGKYFDVRYDDFRIGSSYWSVMPW